MTKWIGLGRLAALVIICLSACNVAFAQTDDPCRLVVNLSTGRPKSPNPTFLESALLNDARSGKNYLAAEIDWMNAQNQLSAAENKVFATEAGTRRLKAETSYQTTVATSLGTPAFQETYSQLLAVCDEIQKLRIQFLASDGGMPREISLVQEEAKAMRARTALGPDAFLARYNAETDLLVAAAANPQAMQKRVTDRLAAAKAARDRLKAATIRKQ